MSFNFSLKNLEKAEQHIKQYPKGKQASAVLPVLDLAQRQNNGWISQDIIEYVANFLDMPSIRVHEVASFYTMFNLKPVGRYHIQVCRTTSCWLRGSEEIMKTCQSLLKLEDNNTTNDDLFTFKEVECLGACVNAPVVQINDDYYENLTPDSIADLIQNLKKKSTSKICKRDENNAR